MKLVPKIHRTGPTTKECIVMENNRGQWGSNFGFLMAAVGSAVGLGNIWGFPYKMGNHIYQ